jgi:hypothetical protein
MIKILKSVDFLKKVLGQHGGPYALVPVGEQLKKNSLWLFYSLYSLPIINGI